MPIRFAKLHGAGNDYIAVDGRGQERDWGALSQAMSQLHFGVGSDGIVVALPSDQAQIRMRVFNPDGSEAEMSGNGIRLFSKFVIDRRIALPGPDGLVVETLGGVRTVMPTLRGGKMVSGRVAMGEPNFVPGLIPVDAAAAGSPGRIFDYPLKVGATTLKVTCLSIGNPHAVAFPEMPVEEFPLNELGPLVERHRLFPKRINFEIANVLDRGRLKARIFERGAGETLSSGTGSTAAAIAAKLHGLTDDRVEVHVPGGVLRIEWPGRGEAFLDGPTVEVFEGVWPD
ncbi:MAG: diaminopimelate epimerase [Chloroflexi bacterium]|nr:diaminopimelate epimerase [Chloroflexota bacterium]